MTRHELFGAWGDLPDSMLGDMERTQQIYIKGGNPDKPDLYAYKDRGGYWNHLKVDTSDMDRVTSYEGRDYAGDVGGEIRTVLNETALNVRVTTGYPTTANGSADNIWCPARKALVVVSTGGPRDFARWKVVSLEDARNSEWDKAIIRSADDTEIVIEIL